MGPSGEEKTTDKRPTTPGAMPRSETDEASRNAGQKQEDKKTRAISTDKTSEQNKGNSPTGFATLQKKERETEKGQNKEKQPNQNQQTKTGQTKEQTSKGQRPAGKTNKTTVSSQQKRNNKTDPTYHTA